MSTILDLITDRGVVTSAASASALAGGASIAVRRTERRVPASFVAFGAIAAAVAVVAASTAIPWSVYLDPPTADRWWTILMIAAAVTAVWFVAGPVKTSGISRDVEFTALLAVATLGVFLAVPETDLLRLLPAPMAVAAMATVTSSLAPFGRVAALVLATGLGWLAVIDGQIRPAAIVGAAGCLAVAALAGSATLRGQTSRPRSWPFDLPSPYLVLGVIGIAVCSRGAGILQSTEAATLIVVAVLVIITTLIVRPTRPTRSTCPDYTNPEGSR